MVTLKLSRSEAGRLQKVVIRSYMGKDLEGCCLVYLALFGGEIVTLLLSSDCSESAVMAPAIPGGWGLAWVCGVSPDGTFFL